LEHADYLGHQGGRSLSKRFLNAADATFRQLLTSPELGSLCLFRHSEAQDLRVWRVKGFEKHLIFYRSDASGIEIVRVLHSARDIDRILDQSDEA
jgi:toxin ParE1/3/4